MTRSFLRDLSHLPGLDAVRAALRDRQQQRRFLQTLALARSPPRGIPSLEDVRRSRRTIPEVPGVLVLGHEDWERHGLWPSWGRLGRVELVRADGPHPWNAERQDLLRRNVLARIDELETTDPRQVVFMYCDSGYISPRLLEELALRGIWTVLMALDDQHKFHVRNEHGLRVGQQLVAPRVDLYWTTWKAAARAGQAIGARTWYAAEGADPAFHRPLPVQRDIEVLFLGARYGIRRRLVQFLRRQGFDVRAYGRGWPEGFVGFEQSVELYSRARVVLGVGNVGEMRGVFHLKGRDFEVPMCGALYLTSFNPDLADWFTIGEEILCYSSFANCAEVLTWILDRPDEQQRIREAALRRSLTSNTWDRRILDVLEHLRTA